MEANVTHRKMDVEFIRKQAKSSFPSVLLAGHFPPSNPILSFRVCVCVLMFMCTHVYVRACEDERSKLSVFLTVHRIFETVSLSEPRVYQ